MNSPLQKNSKVFGRGRPTAFFKPKVWTSLTSFLIAATMVVAFGQESPEVSNWRFHSEHSGAELYVNSEDCDDIILKWVNTTEGVLSVQWNESIVDYSSNEAVVLYAQEAKTANLEPAGSLVGTCDGAGATTITVPSGIAKRDVGNGIILLHFSNITTTNQ